MSRTWRVQMFSRFMRLVFVVGVMFALIPSNVQGRIDYLAYSLNFTCEEEVRTEHIGVKMYRIKTGLAKSQLESCMQAYEGKGRVKELDRAAEIPLSPGGGTSTWAMFKKDPTNVGYARDFITLQSTPTISWTNNLDMGALVRGFCIRDTGNLLICGDDVRIESSSPTQCKQGAGGGGVVRALDVRTGIIVWERACYDGDDIGIFTGSRSPAYAQGMVFFGDNYGAIYALRASDGLILWKKQIGITDHLLVAESKLFISARTGLVVLNQFDGQFLWSHNEPINSPISIGGGKLFGVFNGYLKAMSLDGAAAWASNEPVGLVYNALTYSSGGVYFGSNNKNVYRFDASNGVVSWKKPVPDTVSYASATVTREGYIVFGIDTCNVDYDPCLRAYTSSGVLVWERLIDTYGNQWGSPVTIGGYVAICTYFAKLVLVNSRTGEIEWNHSIDDPGGCATTPVWDGGLLYIGGKNGIIEAIKIEVIPPRYVYTPLIAR